MRDVFKQRRCEQIQTSDLKTGKQKDCIRQKGGSCSNCKGKTMQNNESSNKLLPALTDFQLTLRAVPLPNPTCWGGHSLEDWFLSIKFSFQLVFSPYLVTLWCEFLVSGLVKWESWCTESLLLLCTTFAAGPLRALLTSFESRFRISWGSSGHCRWKCTEMLGGPTSLKSVAVFFASSESC